jgi:hypothetical protein
MDPRQPVGRARSAPSEDQTTPIDETCRADVCTKATPYSALDEVSALVEASIADNTRRAYRSDLGHFAVWVGGCLSSGASNTSLT